MVQHLSAAREINKITMNKKDKVVVNMETISLVEMVIYFKSKLILLIFFINLTVTRYSCVLYEHG